MQITTNLPTSEDAFEKGEICATMTLSSALDTEVSSNLSPYAGIIVIAALFGRLVVHLHRPSGQNHFQDLVHGEFWKRHRKIDSMFSDIVMLLPSRLKIGNSGKDDNFLFLRVTMHSLIIALHQAAVVKAETYHLDDYVIRQSQARSNAAAEEVIGILRQASSREIEEVSVIYCVAYKTSSRND
jgi:hypothetical protein